MPRPGPGLQLALAASTIASIYSLALIAPFPFWRAQPPAPSPASADPAAAAGFGLAGALLAAGFAIALSAPYRPYVLALRVAAAASTRALLLCTSALALVALLVYPAFGSDLFVYLDYERLWTLYGNNPLLAFPDLHPEDWAYAFTWIPQQPSPYGPLWPLLTWPIARAAGENLWGWIVGYKLLALAAYVACTALIWTANEPARRKRAVVLFAWSPLVLFEVLGKAHNDGVLAVCAALAMCLARRYPVAALLVAMAGALVKISGLAAVLAIVILLAHRRAWRALAIGCGLAAVLALALYGPFWIGPETLSPLLFQTGRVVWSPGALIIGLASGILPNPDLTARGVTAAAWVVTCAAVAVRKRDIAQSSSVLLLATLLLLTTAFFAHYLVPLVALGAMSRNARLEQAVMWLSIGSLVAYSVELLGLAMPAGWIGSAQYQVLGSLATLGPCVALICHWGLREGWARLHHAMRSPRPYVNAATPEGQPGA